MPLPRLPHHDTDGLCDFQDFLRALKETCNINLLEHSIGRQMIWTTEEHKNNVLDFTYRHTDPPKRFVAVLFLTSIKEGHPTLNAFIFFRDGTAELRLPADEKRALTNINSAKVVVTYPSWNKALDALLTSFFNYLQGIKRATDALVFPKI